MTGLEQIPWVYDAFMWLAEHGRLRRWRTWLTGGAAGRVVEIGCGTGRNLPFLAGSPGATDGSPSGGVRGEARAGGGAPEREPGAAARDPRVTFVVGIDPHLAPLRKAQRRTPGVPLVQARAEALPFRAGTFDVVVSSLVFCSVDDPAAALDETRRVLAPGGTLRMMEHVRSERPWVARLQDLVQPAWTLITGGCRPNRTTEETVRRAGFRIDAGSYRARGVLRRWSAQDGDRSG